MHSLIVTSKSLALVWYPHQPFVFVHRVTDGVIEPTHIENFDTQAEDAESALAWMTEHLDLLDRPRPERLIEGFEAGLRGESDIDVGAVVHAMIADVLDSVKVALERGDDDPLQTVADYVANHYGDL